MCSLYTVCKCKGPCSQNTTTVPDLCCPLNPIAKWQAMSSCFLSMSPLSSKPDLLIRLTDHAITSLSTHTPNRWQFVVPVIK